MEKTNKYSALFIIVPEKEDSMDEMKGAIGNVITGNGGQIETENMMGKRKLAYPIQKKEEGIYYEVSFSAAPSSIEKMTRQYRINTDLLRALVDKA